MINNNGRIYPEKVFTSQLYDYLDRFESKKHIYCPNCYGPDMAVVFRTYVSTIYKCNSCGIETDTLLTINDIRDKKIDDIIKNPD